MRAITALLLGSLLCLGGCEKEAEQEIAPFESYRYELWKLLVADGWQFDLVGTQPDTYTYPDFQGQSFDRDHEGIGGIQTDGVLANLDGVLAAIDTPDVVLIGLGINDFYRGDDVADPVANLQAIIDKLIAHNPQVTLLIEQIASTRTTELPAGQQAKVDSFNRQVAARATAFTTSGATIIAVDMATDFTDAYFADPVHYNQAGAAFVAGQYYQALNTYLDKSQTYTILPLGDSRVVGYRP